MRMTTPAQALAFTTAGLFMTGLASADEGNRYNKERLYQAEISAAQAYLEMEHSKGHDKSHKHQAKPVLIDVRRLREYAAGHPEDAYNVPYPHKIENNDQTPFDLYSRVFEIVKGDLDTPIMLLCRTGSRSVDAGNILADPDSKTDTQGFEPFTDVRNIWEGFVGQYKYAYNGGDIQFDENGDPIRLDLNNDGEVTTQDVADVYQETADANPDKDGWRNFQGLPWTTSIRRPLAYENDVAQYDAFMTPVD